MSGQGDQVTQRSFSDTRDREAGPAALRRLGEAVEKILAKTGLTEDELVREFGGD